MNTKKILVIDDNKDINQMVSLSFEAEGYVVEQSFNGKDGLSKFHTFKPDIILLDIRMPKMDGNEVLSRIRKNRTPRPFIIIFTNMEWKGKTSNKVYFLKKSDVTPSELAELVKGYLS
jgi:two-component system, OmpR family, alkaline phosphatase synthesis response regulator PhoP